MGLRLEGRGAVVTGAADGMGAAIARLFAEEGADVLAVDLQGDLLAATHADLPSITTIALDIAAEGAAEQIVDKAAGTLKAFDILVNNAGVRGHVGPIYDCSDDSWDRVMSVNLDATFRISRASTPHLTARPDGRIINIGSIQGQFATPGIGPYVASKHGVLGLTRAFALDLGPKGATVNCILPGIIETGMTRTMPTTRPEVWDRLVQKTLVGRAGRPGDIANLALFLACREASFITGACIPVDGGMSSWS